MNTDNTSDEYEDFDEYEEYEEHEYKPEKSDYFWLILNTLVLGYNSYAVTRGICLNTGYFQIVLGLAINLYILYFYTRQFEVVFPKLNKSFSYLILIVTFAIGINIGYMSKETILEKSSILSVTDMIRNQLSRDEICTDIQITKKTSENMYEATALINNGEEIKITIEQLPNDMVNVSIPQSSIEEFSKTD